MVIGFIGTGNMGSALARAAAADGVRILLANRTKEKAEKLAAETGGTVCTNNEIAERADYIFLGVKPQQYMQVTQPLKSIFESRKGNFTIVSMAAGINISRVRELCGNNCNVIRIMPNLPAQTGDGMILYCASGNTVNARELVDIMSKSGKWDEIPEQLIDAGSALSGCGPAFVYMFMDALSAGAQECGLPKEKADLYAAYTVKGAAALAIGNSMTPSQLCDAVCSPGGSTIEGVKSMQGNGFEHIVKDAVKASYKRTLELGK